MTTQRLEISEPSRFTTMYYSAAIPAIGQPTQIGFYSQDGYNNFQPDYSELKYLHLPSNMTSVSFDLNIGHEQATKRPFGNNPNMDCILQWILLNKTEFMSNSLQREQVSSPQFVCSRGVLTHIMCSPYERYDGWIIRATLYKGNIYLCRLPTEKEIAGELLESELDKLMRFWGYKFEQYVTSDSPQSMPENPLVPVNEIREFCCMVRTSVADIPILTSGEVDAIRPEFTQSHGQISGSTSCYVELKTSKVVSHGGQEKTLRRKMGKWWAQSFILGVPTIYCGFRDDGGIVRTLKEYRTQDLPTLCMGTWNPSVCLNFLKDFLDQVRKCVVKDDPRVVYKFEWYPGKQCTWVEMPHPDEYQLLPDWYIEKFQSSAS